jgi:hypothetical protein
MADQAFQERFFQPQLLEAMPGPPDAFARAKCGRIAEVGEGHRRCEADDRLTGEDCESARGLNAGRRG